MRVPLLFTLLLLYALELSASIRVSQQEAAADRDVEREAPSAAALALPQVSSIQHGQADSKWFFGGRSECNDIVLGGMRRLMFWSDTPCRCASGRYIYGDDEECQPYLQSSYFPKTLSRRVCQCRSYSTPCNAGVFISATRQPHLAISRFYINDDTQVFARFEHKSGCTKTYRFTCKDDFASVSSVMRCPDVAKRVSASDIPGKPGPFVRRWEACSNHEGRIRLLQPLIDSTWLAEYPNETMLEGCVEIVAPAQMHALRNVRNGVEEQTAALRARKTEAGGCPRFVESPDVLNRANDFPDEERSIHNILKEFRKRAVIMSGGASFWTRTFGQAYANWYQVMFRRGPGEQNLAKSDKIFTELNCGEPLPLINGPMHFQYAQVAEAAADPASPRQYNTFTIPQTDICFDRSLLIFQSTGQPPHAQVRLLLDEAGFGAESESLPPPPRYEGPLKSQRQAAPTEKMVARQVLPLIMAAIWQRHVDDNVVKDILPYVGAGKLCFFGEMVNHLGFTGFIKKRRIANARSSMLEFAKGGSRYLTMSNLLDEDRYAEAKKLHSQTSGVSASDSLVASMVDSVLFNGFLSTTNMALKCVERQWDDPNHVALYRANKTDYLHELMRMDSAVSSFTTALKEQTTMKLQGIHESLPAGTPVQMSIAGANYDAKVFGDPEEFNPSRTDMSEMLSWNGRLEDVQNRDYERAPRFCPGYKLSMRVATRVCDYFADQL